MTWRALPIDDHLNLVNYSRMLNCLLSHLFGRRTLNISTADPWGIRLLLCLGSTGKGSCGLQRMRDVLIVI